MFLAIKLIAFLYISNSKCTGAQLWNSQTGFKLKKKQYRACSHEPGTVNYPGVMIAPGQELPRVHMMIRCPGATLPRVNFIAPGQVHRRLITTNVSEFLYFLHKLLQKMNFIHVYVFLVHFGTFY